MLKGKYLQQEAAFAIEWKERQGRTEITTRMMRRASNGEGT
jgi:hypothetical protein